MRIEKPDVLTVSSGAEIDHRRNDIQVLRALAVLMVLFFHAGAQLLPAGYLGVDIFFVISGFLVTKMIINETDTGRFSFTRFYLRRARRLLPAAYCTFGLTALFAGAFLLESEYRQFLKQLAGAVTFTANVVLSRQTGYFDGAAELKPLLHVWSLSLEEQAYLLLPALLVAAGRRKRLFATANIFVLSLGCYLIGMKVKPAWTFFMLPTRVWELLMGCLCALALRRVATLNVPRPVLMLALAAVLVVPAMPPGLVAPGFNAIVVTAATAALILGRYGVLEKNAISRRLGIVGDWSYSIYLVHWPLFAFAANAYLNAIPAPVRYSLVAVAVGLAYLQYRFVELPFRRVELNSRILVVGTLAGSFALMVPIIAYVAKAHVEDHAVRDYARVRSFNYGLSPDCDFPDTFREKPVCMTSAAPQYAIWGDSEAMHLLPGLQHSEIGNSLIQVTRSVCGPVLGLSLVMQGTWYGRNWAESCIRFNDSVYEYLKQTPSIRVIVLSSLWEHYFEDKTLILRNGSLYRPDRAALLERFASTIAALRAIGKNVIVIAPPPADNFNIGMCLERLESRRVTVGHTDCDFPAGSYRALHAQVIAFLKDMERRSDVTVLWPSEMLCVSGTCQSQLNGKFLYNDDSHFSYEGSVEFSSQFRLAAKIVQLAR